MMRLLLNITWGLFGLFSLIEGLMFVSAQRSAPTDPWLVIQPVLFGSNSRVYQSGKVTPLQTKAGQAVAGRVIEVSDGWMWFYLSGINRMRLDGTHLQPVTLQSTRGAFIGLSSNRQWLLYSIAEDDLDIYRVRTNGSWAHRFVDLPAHDRPIGFSADGAWLIFVNGVFQVDVWRVNTDTGERQRLTQFLPIESVDLSPDAEWLYISFRDFEPLDTGAHLARLRLDGTDFQLLTPKGNVDYYWQPLVRPWVLVSGLQTSPLLISPDGQWLLLNTLTASLTAPHYYVMHADGQQLHALLIDGKILGWSADNEWIYYEYIPNEQSPDLSPTLYRIRPDGSDNQNLSLLPPQAKVQLSEDGHWIFVSVKDDLCDCLKEYYGIATDTGQKWQIGAGMADVLEGRISPNGQWYYFLAWTTDYQYADLYRIPVGVAQPAEKLARFRVSSYGYIYMFGWFDFHARRWSPVLILSISISTLGSAGFMAWKSSGRRFLPA